MGKRRPKQASTLDAYCLFNVLKGSLETMEETLVDVDDGYKRRALYFRILCVRQCLDDFAYLGDAEAEPEGPAPTT